MAHGGENELLEALLDDALDDFLGGNGAPAAPASGPSVASIDTEQPEQVITQQEPGPRAHASSSMPSASAAPQTNQKGKGLAFDPLGARKTALKPPPSTAPTPPSSASRSSPPPPPFDFLADLEGLGEGDMASSLSKLLQELANVDDEEGDALLKDLDKLASGAGLSPIDPPSRGTHRGTLPTQSSTAEHSLEATLRALADQAPRFSDENQSAAGGFNSEEELLMRLTEQLQGLAGDGGDEAAGVAGPPPGMASLVDTIMQQLLSKDVLYQPLKDIGGRYPSWLDENRSKLTPEDIQRYEEQHLYITKICTLYEEDPSNFEQLVTLLQEMQQRGQPPQEIVDELAPGMSFGPDGLPSFAGEEGGAGGAPPDCCIQ